IRDLINYFLERYPQHRSECSLIISKAIKNPDFFSIVSLENYNQYKEYLVINSAKDFFKKLFNTEVFVKLAEEEIANAKAKQAEPRRVGIIIE
ncbi:MAG: hypothetical protein V1824_02660, partial [archaeon]